MIFIVLFQECPLTKYAKPPYFANSYKNVLGFDNIKDKLQHFLNENGTKLMFIFFY